MPGDRQLGLRPATERARERTLLMVEDRFNMTGSLAKSPDWAPSWELGGYRITRRKIWPTILAVWGRNFM